MPSTTASVPFSRTLTVSTVLRRTQLIICSALLLLGIIGCESPTPDQEQSPAISPTIADQSSPAFEAVAEVDSLRSQIFYT